MTTFAARTQERIETVRDAFKRIDTVSPEEFLPVFVAASNACEELSDYASLREFTRRASARIGQFPRESDQATLRSVLHVRSDVLSKRQEAREVELQESMRQLLRLEKSGSADPWVLRPAQERVALVHSARGSLGDAARWYRAAAVTVLELDPQRSRSFRELAADAVFADEAIAALRAERVTEAISALPGRPAGDRAAVAAPEGRAR